MYHSITFGTKNTWDDWRLIPSSRPLFVPPAMKENKVEIPGANGVLDMSTVLTGFPVYENREGSVEFIVDNDKSMEWHELYSDIMDYLHGRTMQAVLEDDPGYYYEGLFKVNDWRSNADGTWSNIVIDYSVFPYKLEKELTMLSYTFTTAYSPTITVGKMPVTPTFTVSTQNGNGMELTLYDNLTGENMVRTVTIPDGTHTLDDVVLYQNKADGTCKLKFSNSGTVSLSFRKGRL